MQYAPSIKVPEKPTVTAGRKVILQDGSFPQLFGVQGYRHAIRSPPDAIRNITAVQNVHESLGKVLGIGKTEGYLLPSGSSSTTTNIGNANVAHVISSWDNSLEIIMFLLLSRRCLLGIAVAGNYHDSHIRGGQTSLLFLFFVAVFTVSVVGCLVGGRDMLFFRSHVGQEVEAVSCLSVDI